VSSATKGLSAPALFGLYDALFSRGQKEHLEILRNGMAAASPGMAALTAGLEASGR
jgi:hypothetical protein